MMRKLIIWAIVIVAAWLWGSVIFNSCNKNKLENQETVVNDTSNEEEGDLIDYSEADDIEDEHDDRIGNREVEETEDTAETDLEEADSEEMDNESEEDKAREEEEETVAEDFGTNTSSSTRSGKGGRYLVVAGAFRSKDNASGMLRKLKKIGYNNAEIVKFDFDEHHAICVGRYESLSSAKSIAKDLRTDHGIENYVHERRFKKKR